MKKTAKKNNRKYEFTGAKKKFGSYVVRRIRRISDGMRGGWIESESNLSHDGPCFVYDEAVVYGKAEVTGAAVVADQAIVGNQARICERAYVSDTARVDGFAVVRGFGCVVGGAEVCGHAVVSGESRVFGAAFIAGEAKIKGSSCVGEGFVTNDSVIKSPKDFVYLAVGRTRITFTPQNIAIDMMSETHKTWLKMGRSKVDNLAFDGAFDLIRSLLKLYK